jgi:hypothetical protein
MPKVVSLVSPTAPSSGAQKLGQPVWLSNFVVEENRSRAQPAQAKVPARCSSSSGLVKGRSVPLCCRTAYCSGVSSVRHSASLWVTSNAPGAAKHSRHRVRRLPVGRSPYRSGRHSAGSGFFVRSTSRRRRWRSSLARPAGGLGHVARRRRSRIRERDTACHGNHLLTTD